MKNKKSQKDVKNVLQIQYTYNEQKMFMVKESSINHGSWNYSEQSKFENGNSDLGKIQHETVNFTF